MIDKKAFAVLEAIVSAAGEEDTIVLDKEEILADADSILTDSELLACIDDLCRDDLIKLKYSNQNLYAFSPLPKGRAAVARYEKAAKVYEEAADGIKEAQRAELIRIPVIERPLSPKRIAAVVFCAAFVGAFLGAAVIFILSRLL